jgi:pyruvate dehydrogenase E2 component (dihydrolipoamide acetyltransferase)
MPTNILMPALSPTMEEGNLAKWHVKEGDKVKSGDVIAEIETDKATMEVEAVDEGTVGKIVVGEGTQGVKVNAVIAVLLGEGEDKAAIGKVGEGSKTSGAGTPSPQPSPPSGEGAVSAPPPAPKTPSPHGGEGRDEGARAASAQAPAGKANGARVFASPLARRIAKEAGIDLSGIAGSGPHGRIIQADVEKAKAGGVKAPAAKPGAAPAAPIGMSDEQVLKLYEPGSYDVVPHDGMRKIIARRLVEAKSTIPHFYLTVDTEIDALLALRAQINNAAPKDKDGNPAWKVSVNDMVIKAMAMALVRIPKANVTWTEGGMLVHKHVDVGVAVAIPGGLITPVVRKADTKRLSEIANEMKDYAKRARERKLKPEEYQGGSTAVSNLGMFGIKDFSAVINPPHSSILAVGAGEERAVVRKGKIEAATVMSVTLSVDHRAVDGALGAELLSAFKSLIEAPAGMLA